MSGVWSFGSCCHFQVLGAILTGCIDICLEKREERFRGEVGAGCLPTGSNRGEGVGTVESVLVGGLL